MDLVKMQIDENSRKLRMTVLHRENGTWYQGEVEKLTSGLMTEVSGHPQHPHYLIIFGHHTKDATLKALGGGQAYTATKIVGIDDEKIPFNPSFA